MRRKKIFQPPSFEVRRLVWIAVLVALIVWFLTYNARENTLFDSDPLGFSGFIAVFIGLGYSILIDRNQTSLLVRWHDAAIVDLNSTLRQEIENSVRARSIVWQVTFPAVLVILTIFGYTARGFEPFTEFSLVSFLCAFLVGLRLSRLISHGLIGQLLEDRNVPFSITIAHPDRTGGAAQIGTFYFLQASVLMVPVLWLSSSIFFLQTTDQYINQFWENHFLFLLIVTILIFVMAFLVPMLAFRRLMQNWKDTYLAEEISRVRAELLKYRSIQVPTVDQRKYHFVIAYELDNLMHLPNWPISSATRNWLISTIVFPLGMYFVDAVLM